MVVKLLFPNKEKPSPYDEIRPVESCAGRKAQVCFKIRNIQTNVSETFIPDYVQLGKYKIFQVPFESISHSRNKSNQVNLHTLLMHDRQLLVDIRVWNQMT